MHETAVLLVDDHAGLRAELRRLIEQQPDLWLVAEASTMHDAVRLVTEEPITVVVMDLSLPDGDGIAATAAIMRQRPDIAVLGLSRHDDRGHLQQMLAAGARGYVIKRNAADELIPAIRTVAAGGVYQSAAFDRSLPTLVAAPPLAVRNALPVPGVSVDILDADALAVLKRVAWGYSNQEIAVQLDIAPTAVSAHKVQAMQHLGLRTRIDVLRYAIAQGWTRTVPDEG